MAHMPGAGRIHGGMYAVNLGNRFDPRYRFPWNFVLGDGEIRQRQMAIIDRYESFIWAANAYHSTASAALFWDHNWDTWSRLKERICS